MFQPIDGLFVTFDRHYKKLLSSSSPPWLIRVASFQQRWRGVWHDDMWFVSRAVRKKHAGVDKRNYSSERHHSFVSDCLNLDLNWKHFETLSPGAEARESVGFQEYQNYFSNTPSPWRLDIKALMRNPFQSGNRPLHQQSTENGSFVVDPWGMRTVELFQTLSGVYLMRLMQAMSLGMLSAPTGDIK